MTVYHRDDTVTLHLGNALDVLRTLPAGSVNCCVTSPPYLGLRSYLPAGHVDKAAEVGAEATPVEYVERLRAVFCEVRRVLADDGVMFVNLGDSYGPDKNLRGTPWQMAFALRDDGWILRRDIIWAKRNCMPDPSPDRPATAHEYVFMFTKKRRYWYDADAIREDSDPEQEAHNERYARVYDMKSARPDNGVPGHHNSPGIHSRPGKPGRNARSVWTLSSQPFSSAHFAVMPPELARRCIVAGCKPGGTVLDPFHGSGTTGKVAVENGRRYVGIELNREYLDLSLRTRISNGTFDFDGVA